MNEDKIKLMQQSQLINKLHKALDFEEKIIDKLIKRIVMYYFEDYINLGIDNNNVTFEAYTNNRLKKEFPEIDFTIVVNKLHNNLNDN